MNSLVSFSVKTVCTNVPRIMTQGIAGFATTKEKGETAKSKSKKESKSESANMEKQVKSLLKHYYKMRTYIPPKLSEEKQQEYAAAAKEYSRQMTRLHHYYEAISALPTEALREQAKKTDYEQIPGKYFYPAKKARFEDLSKELAWFCVCLHFLRVVITML